MNVTKNAAFAGVVETTAFTDWGDPTNPYGTTLLPLTFSPTPIQPARHRDLDDVRDDRRPGAVSTPSGSRAARRART